MHAALTGVGEILKVIERKDHRGTGKRKILYGTTYRFEDGKQAYIAIRSHAKIYTAKEITISSAMREEVAAWSFDEGLLFDLKARKVDYIGVKERDTEYRYLTYLWCFFDRKTFKTKMYQGIGSTGKTERYVPLHRFVCYKSLLKIKSKIQKY